MNNAILMMKMSCNNMKRCNPKRLTLYLMLFCVNISYSQMLWPGDVNNNGVVNGIDVLYAGIAYGNTGAVRPAATQNWQAQTLGPLWTQDFFDGINHAYADCDGNGIIDEDDIKETIKDNFFLTHGVVTPDVYSSGTPANAPAVRLIPQNVNVGIGATVVFELWLGDEEMLVQDFYGIVFVLRYNPDFTLGSEWEFEGTNNPWFDPSDDNYEDIHVEDEPTGLIELAITRTNQQSVSGAGKMGEFSVVIEDIIFGLEADTLHLEIEKIRMIDKDFNTLPVVSDSTFVVISRPNSISTPLNDERVQVFPNPTNKNFTISSDYNINGFEIRDITGREIPISETLPPNTKTFKISKNTYQLKPQLYLLKLFTEEGIVVKKLVLN